MLRLKVVYFGLYFMLIAMVFLQLLLHCLKLCLDGFKLQFILVCFMLFLISFAFQSLFNLLKLFFVFLGILYSLLEDELISFFLFLQLLSDGIPDFEFKLIDFIELLLPFLPLAVGPAQSSQCFLMILILPHEFLHLVLQDLVLIFKHLDTDAAGIAGQILRTMPLGVVLHVSELGNRSLPIHGMQ
jgi:hypothetical protein